jgi:hypothetical protein
MKNGMSRCLVIRWLVTLSRPSLLSLVLGFAFGVFLSYSSLAATPTKVSDILGTPTQFISNFRANFEGKLNEYVGLLVSFHGAGLVIKSLIKS